MQWSCRPQNAAVPPPQHSPLRTAPADHSVVLLPDTAGRIPFGRNRSTAAPQLTPFPEKLPTGASAGRFSLRLRVRTTGRKSCSQKTPRLQTAGASFAWRRSLIVKYDRLRSAHSFVLENLRSMVTAASICSAGMRRRNLASVAGTQQGRGSNSSTPTKYCR